MGGLTLEKANRVIAEALASAGELGLNPLGIVVLDAGGHLIAAQRQDGSPLMRLDIAWGKAYGALAYGAGTRRLNAAALERPHFVNAFVAASGGKVIPVPGGVLVRNAAGDTIGAVGVSGDTSDNDEACALAGIASAGFEGIGD